MKLVTVALGAALFAYAGAAIAAEARATSDAQFRNDVEASSMPVVVFFNAPWCGPCRAMTPLIQDAAQSGNLPLFTVNIDDNPQSVGKYGIRSIPVVMVFRNGGPAGTLTGARNKEVLGKFLADSTR